MLSMARRNDSLCCCIKLRVIRIGPVRNVSFYSGEQQL